MERRPGSTDKKAIKPDTELHGVCPEFPGVDLTPARFDFDPCGVIADGLDPVQPNSLIYGKLLDRNGYPDRARTGRRGNQCRRARYNPSGSHFAKMFVRIDSTIQEMTICWHSRRRPIEAQMSGHYKDSSAR
jgi:hypothetical protein